MAGLARTRLARSVHDAGWSQFTAMLEYKAALYGRTFVKIGRFEPTSQDCSACGVKDGPKPLSVREWTCGGCGAVHDRDVDGGIPAPSGRGGRQWRGKSRPRSASGRGPKMRRSASVMATSLMLASRRVIRPCSSNSHSSLP